MKPWMLSRRKRWMILLVTLFVGCNFYYWPVTQRSLLGRGQESPPLNRPYFTDVDEQMAVEIIRASGVVERVNGGQVWEPDFRVPGRWSALAGTRGMRVEVTWEGVVNSAGPWALVKCEGTRKVVHKQKWNLITRLVTWVDLDARSVVAYGVASWPEDNHEPTMGSANWLSLVKVYDVESGKRLLVVPPFLVPPKSVLCPPGRYYRD